MTHVKSPYNFVPAPRESEVFKCDWADQVCHDIPFEDGESGEIELMLRAETPIFVRNGHAEGKDTSEFSHVVVNGKKKYFIPATSLKGMLRNVLEIMTQSRMKLVDDDRHAVRQIMITKGTVIVEGYSLTEGDEKKNIKAGYLVEKDTKYYIYSCGKPMKIRYTDLDDVLGTDFGEQFDKPVLKSEMDKKFANRTGKYKYEKVINGKSLEHKFVIHPLDDVDKNGKEYQKSWVSEFQPLSYVLFANSSDDDFFYGRIVCVGQASNYSVSTARKGEYVFRGKREDVITDEKVKIEVPEKVMETFLFINRHNLHDELDDWKYWKNKLKEGVPVFYRSRQENGKEVVKDFGLTFMYKEPVKYSVKECLKYEEDDNDFAELLFGYTSKKQSLKGRVVFSHAFLTTNINDAEMKELTAAFAGPKSSYVPFYLKQNGNGKTHKFNTYNSNPVLRGYKRYPIHKYIKKLPTGSDARSTCLKPLPKDSIFSLKIRFFNLKKVEIGALLSAITFHGSNDELYHSLGAAKPFGYGKMKILDVNIKTLNYENGGWEEKVVKDYLGAFECEMKTKMPDWNSSEFIRELTAMSKEQKDDALLEYMELAHFQELKNTGRFLQNYTQYDKSGIELQTECSDLEGYKKERKKRKVFFEKERERLIAFLYRQDIQEIDKLIAANEYEKAKKIAEKHPCEDVFVEKLKGINKAETQWKAREEWGNVNKEDRAKIEEFIKRWKDCDVDVQELMQAQTCLNNLMKQKKEKRAAKAAASTFDVDYAKGFDKFKKEINKQFKLANGEFGEEKLKWIEKVITDFYRRKDKKFFKKNKLVSFKKYPWTDISKWLGEDNARELYEELTEKGN